MSYKWKLKVLENLLDKLNKTLDDLDKQITEMERKMKWKTNK